MGISRKTVSPKDFRAFGVADVRHMTAATAAVTLACLFTEWLYSSYVFSTRIGLHRIELINKTLVNDDFSKKIQFSIYLC